MNKVFFIAFIVLFSCADPAEEQKKDILSDDTMVSLIVQMNIIEGDLIFTQSLDANVQFEGYKRYKGLFKRYGTDSAEVARSFDYYTNRKEELRALYQRAMDSLTILAEKNKVLPGVSPK